MPEIRKISKDELTKVLHNEIKSPLEQWKRDMLSTIMGVLTKSPARYRAFGPHWWPLKKIFIDAGETAFGDSMDAEWLEVMDYGNDAVNILAAYVYEERRLESGSVYYSFHPVETKNGDIIEFNSYDADMEQ